MTDPSPLIMGMPILHLGYKSQPPPWLDLIQQGISTTTAVIARSHQVFAGRVSLFHSNWRVLTKDQWVLQTVTQGYHIHCTSHLRTHSGDHAIQPSLLIGESDPGDSYLAGEAGGLHGQHVTDGQLKATNSESRPTVHSSVFLGFVINNKTSVLTPCQQMEFLGMTVDSQSIVLKLPGE